MPHRALQITAAWFVLALLQPTFPAIAAEPSGDLLEAARRGMEDQVKALLAKGAALEAADKEGRTPLMLAAQYGRTRTVKLLLAKGANSDARDSRGWNAFMLALMAPSGGVVHTSHDAVLKLLPQPARLRVAVEAAWAPGRDTFSSCFMRPEQLAQHIRDIRPDSMVAEAFQRFATVSGRDLIAIVHTEVHGMAAIENAGPPDDADAILTLRVEPGVACVQQSDRLSLLIHARLVRKADPSPVFEKEFGSGVKTGMREELAANANQHAPLYEAWAKSQAGPLYWGVVAALMQSTK
jgi:Ankyrin repeats (3 copies)